MDLLVLLRFKVDLPLGIVILPVFAGHLIEESSDGVVIALCPAIEGMVMALGAFETRTKENLGDRLALLIRLSENMRQRGWRIGELAAARGEESANHLVIRHVF